MVLGNTVGQLRRMAQIAGYWAVLSLATWPSPEVPLWGMHAGSDPFLLHLRTTVG
jgi:hypothetical protein